MSGQPAWTLTEMLECNLPLCWAGGGDCKVGPAQKFWRPNLYSLKPIRALCFMGKHMSSSSRVGKVFSGVVFPLRCEAARLLAGVRDFSGAENKACWAIFLGAENQQRQ